MINPVDDTSWVGRDDELHSLFVAKAKGMITKKEFDILIIGFWKSIRGGSIDGDPFSANSERYKEVMRVHGLAWDNRIPRRMPTWDESKLGFRIVRNKQ